MFQMFQRLLPYFYPKIFYKHLWKNIYRSHSVQYLHMNIGIRNFPKLFFDILYHTTIIYEEFCTGFRRGRNVRDLHIAITVKNESNFYYNFVNAPRNTDWVPAASRSSLWRRPGAGCFCRRADCLGPLLTTYIKWKKLLTSNMWWIIP